MSELAGLIKGKYGRLQGRDWIRRIEPEDAQVLILVGLRETDFGRKGGKARADTARRDHKGRFSRKDGHNKLTDWEEQVKSMETKW